MIGFEWWWYSDMGYEFYMFFMKDIEYSWGGTYSLVEP